jgi:fatty acid desaturase (delta-4 desaturase)
VNRLLGLGQNWIGGSAVDWIHQHVVQHHVNCNDVDNDPDIVGNPILRFNPRAPIAQWHGFQYCYLFALLSLFGLTYITDSLKHVTEAFHYTKYSKLLEKNRLFEQCTILFMMFRWTVLPLLLKSADQSLLSLYANILPLYIVGGYYLSFFFVISHNFEGVEMHDNNYAKKIEQSFLRKQVRAYECCIIINVYLCVCVCICE